MKDDDDIQDYVRPWVGLTEDERGGILVTYCEAGLWRLSEAIEAKLKEKNNG